MVHRSTVGAIAFLAALAAVAGTARAQHAFPRAMRGLVVDAALATRTEVSLAARAGGPARLHVEAHVAREPARTITIDWTGRARVAGDVLTIGLHALTESAPVPGSAVVVTTRSSEDAQLTCAHEEHDLFAPSPPTPRGAETVASRRRVVACRFAPEAVPRPLRDLLVAPLSLAGGAGVTTDIFVTSDAIGATEERVLREPGWAAAD